jgi:hypothetical protein
MKTRGQMNTNNIQKMRSLHPNWFSATDYKWLREHKHPKTDISRQNKLDDENRRIMGNWSYNDFTQ